jgi:hypothetical protein
MIRAKALDIRDNKKYSPFRATNGANLIDISFNATCKPDSVDPAKTLTTRAKSCLCMFDLNLSGRGFQFHDKRSSDSTILGIHSL